MLVFSRVLTNPSRRAENHVIISLGKFQISFVNKYNENHSHIWAAAFASNLELLKRVEKIAKMMTNDSKISNFIQSLERVGT